jgi:hypothetical protein
MSHGNGMTLHHISHACRGDLPKNTSSDQSAWEVIFITCSESHVLLQATGDGQSGRGEEPLAAGSRPWVGSNSRPTQIRFRCEQFHQIGSPEARVGFQPTLIHRKRRFASPDNICKLLVLSNLEAGVGIERLSPRGRILLTPELPYNSGVQVPNYPCTQLELICWHFCWHFCWHRCWQCPVQEGVLRCLWSSCV